MSQEQRTERYQWSKKVKEKAKWVCEHCGLKPNKKFLHAHHIKSWADYPKLRFETNNGICLCLMCHGKFYHKDFVRFVVHKPKGVTKKAFMEYLNLWKENQLMKKKKSGKGKSKGGC